ncbi:ribulose-phosphate 3-epimerase [Loigolactobacillus binensis]|uniref:Ribulose-phosphate 3-epimerase n=1 Tax=Loigolactobacillus binensis TaxID=2559922 RepID=A0ABW3EHV6_9LACO|nr:ribulose-phosphate 3-epimerase [Loigolactobacillus binensis]
MIIAPSILSADFGHLERDIKLVENEVKYLHVDVMDGHFVPNITFGPDMVAAIHKFTNLTLDCHLMIDNPADYVEQFAAAGGDILTVHIESTVHIDRVLQQIKNKGVKAGIVLNPGTSVTALSEVLPTVDQVLVMTVNPGFGGQTFIPRTLQKIAELAKLREANGYHYDIEVDGGVNETTIKQCSDAGANVFVAGSYIYGHIDPIAQIKKLEAAI